MPHIDDVLSDRKLTDPQQAVLSYLQAHPNEVFSSEDVEELRAKVGVGSPASLGATLETLYRMGCIERQKVRARYFYGTSEAIGRLRTRMTETASERGQREA
jgi:Fe2+ or Zn2+ uptake regulation protein